MLTNRPAAISLHKWRACSRSSDVGAMASSLTQESLAGVLREPGGTGAGVATWRPCLRYLTDSEFCWRGLCASKAEGYTLTNHTTLTGAEASEVERCTRGCSVGDQSSGLPAQQQFPVRELTFCPVDMGAQTSG